MTWAAVAIGGAAVIGAGASAYSSNQASKAAAGTAKNAAKDANSTQLYMYDQSRGDFSPFLQPSNRALATLQSSIYGGPVEYDDASTNALTNEEIMLENWKAIQANPNNYKLRDDVWNDIRGGEDPASRLMREGSAKGGQQLTNLPYAIGGEWYRGADGKLTNQKPQKLTATFKPVESEGFQYTKSRTLADLGRSLRMMGRGTGTVAANATGRTLGELHAANEDKQRNELWNLAKVGQGAAGAVTSSGMNYANNVSGNQMATGNTLAQLQLQNGQTNANLWAGLGGAAGNAASLYSVNKYLNK
jgi:hypothetical protein